MPVSSSRCLPPSSYRAFARRLRFYADRIEACCDPQTPRERASLTRLVRVVHDLTRILVVRHSRRFS